MQDVFEDGPKRDRRLWLGDLRLEALANKKLDKAQAEAELNAQRPGSTIRDLTAKYEQNPDVDKELEALKASLGMTTAAPTTAE